MYRSKQKTEEVQSAQPMHFDLIDEDEDGDDAEIQNLQYFSVKDKGYHVSVWPRDQRIGEHLEFPIAGMTYVEDIDSYLGEFVGTLVADPQNQYDSNAIKVVAGDGHRVGYVPKNQTGHVRDFTSLPCKCYCYIGTNNGTYFSSCYITDRPNVSPNKQ